VAHQSPSKAGDARLNNAANVVRSQSGTEYWAGFNPLAPAHIINDPMGRLRNLRAMDGEIGDTIPLYSGELNEVPILRPDK